MKKKFGFTLFELLISISIIGILVAIATISYSSAQKKARDSRRMEDMTNIQKAAEMYYSTHSGSYPVNTTAFTTSGVLQTWPKDPKLNSDYVYQPDVPVAGSYCVCVGLDNAIGNSNSGTCGAFVVGTGTSQCVTSQQ